MTGWSFENFVDVFLGAFYLLQSFFAAVRASVGSYFFWRELIVAGCALIFLDHCFLARFSILYNFLLRSVVAGSEEG